MYFRSSLWCKGWECSVAGRSAAYFVISFPVLHLWFPVILRQAQLAIAIKGQVENAEVRKPKYGNGSTETEVRK